MADVFDKQDGYDFADRRAESSDEFQLDVQAYLRILRKYKWAITLGTALVTCAAMLYVLSVTPVYRSTATLLIESQKANTVGIEELIGGQSEDRDYYLTQYELLKSRKLAERVVAYLGLNDHVDLNPERLSADKDVFATIIARLKKLFTGSPSNQEQPEAVASADQQELDLNKSAVELLQDSGILGDNYSLDDIKAPTSNMTEEELNRSVGRYLRKLDIQPIRNTKLVKISYESVDPVMAATVANTVGEQYILSYLDAKMEMTMQASQWLNERLAQLKITLDASEQKLLKYKQDNNLIDVNGSVAKVNETTLLLATTELSEAKSKLSDISELYEEVKAVQASTPEYLDSIPAIQDDALVRSVKIEQGQRQRELDELLNRYGPKHPKVVDAQSRLNSLDTLMGQHTARIVGSIEKNYKLARQRVASLERTLATGRQEIQEIGKKSFELEDLEREVATNRSLYDTFFARVSETRSTDQMATANARISDRAVVNFGPVKPQKQLIVGLAALASLVLLSLLAILYESMDDTIKGTSDIESKLRVRLLGTIPLLKGGLFNRGRKIPINPMEIDETHSTFVEAIRTIRTALNAIGNNAEPNKTIVITSSIPGEGKSTASLNIAYAMSKLERVILIDADMRRPAIGRALNMPKNEPGLSNLISGTANVRDCIKRKAIGELDIIPCGEIPDHPLELISSSRFAELLNKLSEHYDRIIIDSAPTQAVSDALVLGSLADAIVYIVKSHATSYDLVKRGLERLGQMDIHVAGIVVTQVDFDKIKSYGGDHYYQGYYDYYGYGKESKGFKKRGKKKPATTFVPIDRRSSPPIDSIGSGNTTRAVDLEPDVGRSRQVNYSRDDMVASLGKKASKDGRDVTLDLGDSAKREDSGKRRRPVRFEENDFDIT